MQLSSVRSCLFLNFLALCRAGVPISDHYHSEGQPCTKFKRGGNDVLIFPNEAASHIPRPPFVVDSLDRAGLPVDVEPSPCPGGKAYCETDDDYPVDQIKELLKQQPKSLLGQFNLEVGDDEGGNRFGPDSDEYELCPSNVKVIFPKKARVPNQKNNDSFEFIINTENHRQGVRVEECIYGNECSIPGSLSLGYSSECIQKHIVRTLVVLNTDSTAGGGFVTKPFEFPSCCSCRVTMSGANRFGLAAAGPASPATKATSNVGLKLTKS